MPDHSELRRHINQEEPLCIFPATVSIIAFHLMQPPPYFVRLARAGRHFATIMVGLDIACGAYVAGVVRRDTQIICLVNLFKIPATPTYYRL